MSKKSNQAKKKTRRAHTLKAAAAELGIYLSTIRNWVQREGAPFTRSAKGRISCDVDEVRAWANEQQLTGKMGRPKKETDEGAHWLARKRRMEALKLEGAVIDRAEHMQVVSQLATVAADKLRGLPAAAAPALFGKSIPEIEAALLPFIDDICLHLSDPANYRLGGDAAGVVRPVEAADQAEAE